MIAAAVIARVVTTTRGLNDELDSLRITRGLIESGVLLGDEAYMESRVIEALDEAGWESAPVFVIVACLLDALGFDERAA